MTYRLRNIAVAIALAVLAALLTSFYVNQQKERLQAGQEPTTVFVASKDIQVGTPGSEVAALLEEQQVAKEAVVPGAIVGPSDVEGKVVTEKVYAGEQVTTLRFRAPSEQGVRAALSGNLRAVQVPGDSHQLLAGTLKENDRVDVVANLSYKVVQFGQSEAASNEDNMATRIVLRDILVLRAPQQLIDAGGVEAEGNADKSVLLALTDAQAQKLFFVMKNGAWTLELRPPTDPTDSPEGVETIASVLADGLSPAQLAQLTRFRPGPGPREE